MSNEETQLQKYLRKIEMRAESKDKRRRLARTLAEVGLAFVYISFISSNCMYESEYPTLTSTITMVSVCIGTFACLASIILASRRTLP